MLRRIPSTPVGDNSAVVEQRSSVYGLLGTMEMDDATGDIFIGGVLVNPGLGASGNPGGISGQMQYNNAGSFSGTAGLDWDSASKSLSGTFSLVPFSSVSTPVILSNDFAVLTHANNTPFCGAATGLAAGNYAFKIAVSDISVSMWSNIVQYSFTVPSGALDGTDYWEVDFNNQISSFPVDGIVHLWVSFNSGSYQHVLGGCDPPYTFLDLPTTVTVFADGSLTFDALPVPTGPQLNTLLGNNMLDVMKVKDINGDLHQQAFVDTFTTSTETGAGSSGPPAPDGTFTFTRRVWFRDQQAVPQAGKNAFVSINHMGGRQTVQTNQDRALFVSISDDPDNDSSVYGLQGINAILSINGAPIAQPVIDGEYTALSVQVGDNHIGSLSAPNFGINCARMSYFRNSGSWGSVNPTIMNLAMINNTTDNGGGMALTGISVAVFDGLSGGRVNTNGAAIHVLSPGPTGRMNVNWGLLINDFGTNASDYAIQVLGGQCFFAGPIISTSTLQVATHTPISASDTGLIGTIAWDANFFYQCVAANTWKRTAIASW